LYNNHNSSGSNQPDIYLQMK